jgi:hypothetical protein
VILAGVLSLPESTTVLTLFVFKCRLKLRLVEYCIKVILEFIEVREGSWGRAFACHNVVLLVSLVLKVDKSPMAGF